MKRFAFLLALLLVGCGGGSSGPALPTGVLAISCADVSNDVTSVCGSTTTAASVLVTFSETKAVSRSEEMWLSGTMENGTDERKDFYYEFRLLPGCNGEPDRMLSSSAGWLEPHEGFNPFHGTQCSTMPLGPAEMHFLLYDSIPTRHCQDDDEIDPDLGQQCFKTLHGVTIDALDRFPAGMEHDLAIVSYVVTE